MMEWANEVPRKPGYYWFYGWAWRAGSNEQHRREKLFDLVKVTRIGGGTLMYVISGTFMYPKRGESEVKGLWHPAIVPDLPTEIDSEESE